MNTTTKDEALKMAIKEFEEANDFMWCERLCTPYDEVINACKEALEQPAQEPVEQKKIIGWRTEDYLSETDDPAMARNWECHYKMLPIFEGDLNTKLVPNSSHPHQWQGLTDDEIGKLFSEFIASHHTPTDSFKVIAGFARAIEQAHGIGVKDGGVKRLTVPQQIEKAWNDAVAIVGPDKTVHLLKDVDVGDLLFKDK